MCRSSRLAFEMSDGTARDLLSWGRSKVVVCRSQPRTQGGLEQQIRVNLSVLLLTF
jgi:hypothetical protein